ncbi:histidinol dehydrogenase [Humisphaera borealis]|uniref:Histidinol dehydrogenase n=1 Tax=Humisphaera borealis TaxID=2807512 RepID=A0A7M2WUT6_9BACT|nr:histidinol dehydrogenase [Humisphaera borealis]QOV89288.1 histidinol dehydrogenase [Humisphaera borealis]
MIPTLQLSVPADRARAAALLDRLRLKPADVVLQQQQDVAAVMAILADVAKRGDDAIVDSARKFDDPAFTAEQIRVAPEEMKAAHGRIPAEQMSALKRSIAQVREYQQHILPQDPEPLKRPGVELGLRYTPLDSAGCYFPGGKAAYPSSLIMLSVPAQVAGVKRVVVCTPPSKYGKSDLVLAACHELKLTDVYRAGGAAAIAAMAFGTKTIPAVDKIVGPGNRYVQLAKRALAGVVGIDGFLGPSEILVLADDTANPAFIAADLIAQAEHDPGSCFLLTDSEKLAAAVTAEIEKQVAALSRIPALKKSLVNDSAILISESWDELLDWGNAFAAEHVNIQTKDDDAILAKLRHGGAIFVGPYSPVAAGDYIAGPSHCLPTNTTARFSSGISAIEFMKRGSVERYDREGLAADAQAIITLAHAEGLDGHAASVAVRL